MASLESRGWQPIAPGYIYYLASVGTAPQVNNKCNDQRSAVSWRVKTLESQMPVCAVKLCGDTATPSIHYGSWDTGHMASRPKVSPLWFLSTAGLSTLKDG